MPTIAEMAHVTVSGQSALPASNSADPVAEASWLIHTAAVEAAKRNGITAHDEAGNLLVVDNLKAHARFLYPAVQWEDATEAANFLRPVYAYLRATGAAVVRQRNVEGDPYKTLWALAPTFDAGTAVKTRKRREPTRTETKLTKAEAGEDRTPAPVTVRQNANGEFHCAACNKTFTSEAGLAGHNRMHGPSEGHTYTSTAAKRKRAAKKSSERRKGIDFFASLTPGNGKAVATGDAALPWGCPDCGSKHASAHSLGGHRKIHNKARAAAAALAAPVVETPAAPAGAPVAPVAPIIRRSRKKPAATPTAEAAPAAGKASANDVQRALAVLAEALGGNTDVAALSAKVDALAAQVAQVAAERDAYKAKFDGVKALFAS